MQAGKRQIESGAAFSRYFPKARGLKQLIVKTGGTVEETVALCQKVISETLSETKQIAPLLAGKDRRETAEKIWRFIITYIQYQLDNRPEDIGAVERVRTPARTWADRKQGADCEDYAIFISSVLTNLGMPHSLRVTKYNGKAHWQHIYVVMPAESGAGYITIDPVVDYRFDYEVPYSQKRDYSMPVLNRAGLSGLGQAAGHTTLCGCSRKADGIDAYAFAGDEPDSLLPLQAHSKPSLSGLKDFKDYTWPQQLAFSAGAGLLLYWILKK
jgi:predicted transglutaminase-like cysteine proteinase